MIIIKSTYRANNGTKFKKYIIRGKFVDYMSTIDKICNKWSSFYNDIENIKSNLFKNAYPPFLIDNVIKTYLDHSFSSNQNQLKDTSNVYYFKLPYIGKLSHLIKNKLSKLAKNFVKKNYH